MSALTRRRADASPTLVLVTAGVTGLSLGLVKGNDWGWDSAATVLTLVGAVAVLAAFAIHCVRHRNPLIDARLFAVRAFTGSSLVALVFSIVLFAQEVWGWSALATGLSIAPGPLMVPVFAFGVAGRLIRRYGPGPVIAAGATIFAIGSAWWAAAVSISPNYVSGQLGGMILTGVGVGLTLPTFMATGTSSLPPSSFATGSAVINMLRQVGLAVGVAVLVAVLGVPHGASATLSAYRHAWEVIALASVLAAIVGAVTLGRGPVTVAAADSAATGPGAADGAVAETAVA
jgi:MFS family permease